MRTAFNIALVISILYVPWWISLLIVTAGFFFIERFYEGIFYGILADALYGTSFGVHGFQYVGTFYTTIVFFCFFFIRGRLAL